MLLDVISLVNITDAILCFISEDDDDDELSH
jgi:hypothetical protein